LEISEKYKSVSDKSTMLLKHTEIRFPSLSYTSPNSLTDVPKSNELIDINILRKWRTFGY